MRDVTISPGPRRSIAAVQAGFGIGVLPHPIARRDADLAPIFREAFTTHLSVWIAIHEVLKVARRRIQIAFGALVEGKAAQVEAAASIGRV